MQYFLSDTNCSYLKHLRVSCCFKITDKTLINMMRSTQSSLLNLEKLYINDTVCSQKGMFCIKISVIMEFMRFCPNCEVIYNMEIDINKKDLME